MSTCDFDVDVWIVDAAGVPVLNLNDRVAGYTVESFQEPGDATNKVRVASDFADGDYTVSETDAAGDLVVVVRVEGASWAECASRFQALRAAYRAESSYYVDTVVEGVTTRYTTGRPDEVTSAGTESVNLVRKRQTYSIRWHVQPNPSVTIV